MAIQLVPIHEQTAKVVDIVACNFGDGHDWVDVTTVMDIETKYMCRYCDAKATESDGRTGFR